MKKLFGILFLVFFMSTSISAQEVDTSAIESKISWDPFEVNIYSLGDMPQMKIDLILTLLEESGTISNLQDSFRQMYTSVPEEQRAQIVEAINIHEIVEQIMPIYNRYYTEIDLQQIIGFLKSPSGKKMIEFSPQITQEAIMVTAKYFKTKLQP